MVFTPNDFAYMGDIEALDKKITALAVISHSNDVSMFSTIDTSQFALKSEIPDCYSKTESNEKYAHKSDVVSVDLNNYPTVDVVNEALENYVLKSEYDNTFSRKEDVYTKTEIDDKYRQKDDLTYKAYRNLEITHEEGNSAYYVDYVCGMNIRGSFTNYNNKKVNFDFNFIPIINDTGEYYTQNIIIDGETYIIDYQIIEKNLGLSDADGNYFDNIEFEYIKVETNSELVSKQNSINSKQRIKV